jgi:5-methylcytosine-specific restriction protein A
MAKTRGHGNSDWTRDETILALDLYFKCDGKMPSATDARVGELSLLLRSLPLHLTPLRTETFRNPDGVAFKLKNLNSVAIGGGFGNVSETDRRVWAEFGGHRDKVKRLAELIRVALVVESMEVAAGDQEEEFFEGRLLTTLHKKKERHPKIRGKLLTSRRKRGALHCDMCLSTSLSTKANFEDAAFEAHHTLPMSMALERKTRISDMALLCANCHRLLHRAIALNGRWLTIEEARGIIGLQLL